MAKAYYSTQFEQSADAVWAVIRDFGNYTVWVERVDESYIEEGKSGDAVGSIRNVRMGDTRIRQKLLAHSDLDRSYAYGFCEPSRFLTLRDYRATLRATPIVDGNKAFIEWWATFDCPADDHSHWTAFFETSFAKWLGSLRAHLVREPSR